MAKLIETPTVVPAAGEPPKIIEEFVGRVNSDTDDVSVARMTSPSRVLASTQATAMVIFWARSGVPRNRIRRDLESIEIFAKRTAD